MLNMLNRKIIPKNKIPETITYFLPFESLAVKVRGAPILIMSVFMPLQIKKQNYFSPTSIFFMLSFSYLNWLKLRSSRLANEPYVSPRKLGMSLESCPMYDIFMSEKEKTCKQ